MLPSTCPSRYRSSLPESSPLMTTDLPICANPLAGAVIGAVMGALIGRSPDFLISRILTKLARNNEIGSNAKSHSDAGVVFLTAVLAGNLAIPRAAVISSSAQDSTSPIALVSAAVANEVAAANNDSVKHMFRARRQTPQGSQTRLYVETREARSEEHT